MNYKSGDLVKIAGNNNNHDFSMGEIVRLKHNCGGEHRVWVAEYLDGHDFWYVLESDMKPFKPAIMPQKIVITTDGKTTLARLFDGKAMVKRAEAKCAPSDTFDFGVGTELAVKRLIGENPVTEPVTDSKPEPVKLYCVKSYKPGEWLTKGKIYEAESGFIVTYDDGWKPVVGCSSIEEFHNYCPETGAPLWPLVRRPAKVGEWVYIVDADPAFCNWYNGNYKNGDVMRITSLPPVDRRGSGVMSGKNYMVHSEYLVLDGYHGDPT